VRAALSANNYLAAVGSTKGSFIQVNLTANTDMRSHRRSSRSWWCARKAAPSCAWARHRRASRLGAEDYDTEVRFSGETAVFIGVWPLPNGQLPRRDQGPGPRRDEASSRSDLPEQIVAHGGLRRHHLHPKRHRRRGQDALAETVLIVVIVIFLFLGSLRSVLVPVVAIPVSLIGAVFLMQVFGFTVNLLTLLGHRAGGGSGGRRRHRGGGERGAPPARGATARWTQRSWAPKSWSARSSR
jgi:multidrug efflux pump